MELTREKAKLEFFTLLESGIIDFKEKNIIDKIYDSFEEREIFLATKDLCTDSCKHYLSDNGNYPLDPCSECSRFYADMWESKWKI